MVILEDYTRGPVFVASSVSARMNKDVFERHLNAEWASDIEGTMATIHPDAPFQKIPALGVDVRGFEGVRRFYEGRFASWPGPALKHFHRVAVTRAKATSCRQRKAGRMRANSSVTVR